MNLQNSTIEEWKQEQENIRSRVIVEDTLEWQHKRRATLVGGLDLSYVKNVEDSACAALVVCQLPDMQVVYEDIVMVKLSAPYVPGFLAFREAAAFARAIERLAASSPHLFPQCFLLDGNGLLHPRSCGLACHVGVLSNCPTIGVAKNLYQMESLLRDAEHNRQISQLKNKGDSFLLQTTPGQTLGVALKTSASSSKPVFVSVGHNIGLETATWLVTLCCKYRVPEPIRQADIRSREFLRTCFPDTASSTQEDDMVKPETVLTAHSSLNTWVAF